MKKEINPIAIIAAVVVALGVAGYFVFQALNGTAQTVHVEGSDPNPAAQMNGKKIPPGVPSDYMKNMQGGAGAPQGGVAPKAP